MDIRLKAIGIGLAALGFSASASAVTGLTLTGPIPGNTIGPQSTSNPCIIAGTTCSQPTGFGYNNFKQTGNITAYNMYSTTPTAEVADGVQGTPYTIAQLDAIVNLASFKVAIDVNTASNGETLHLFEVIVNGVVLYNYVGPTALTPIANNGNGYADWTLGNIDLSAYANTAATVLFHAQWSGASDGAESFFLIGDTVQPPCVPGTPDCAQVPEPGTLALLGLGILGLGLSRRRPSVG